MSSSSRRAIAPGSRATRPASSSTGERARPTLMATWADVRAIGLAFPDVEEAPSDDGTPALKVRGRPFCRLWGPREYARDAIDDTEVVVVFCDLDAKEALIEGSLGALFEAPHYVGWGAVPMRLA